VDLGRDFKFKDGDGPRFAFHAETTDKIILFGANGRFYTLSAANLPGGRGMGEPVRLMVDLPNDVEIVDMFVHQPDRKLIVASKAGNGFVVPEAEVVAQTKNGKQVLNVSDSIAKVVRPVTGDHVAVVSENRKLLVFPLSELPEMGRGKGVRLQKYNMARGRQGTLDLDGGLSDLTTFDLATGLSWAATGDRTRTEVDMGPWIGKRATVGKQPPHGFPKSNTFT
jgi:topoisomerase-4 subunit A